MPEKGEQKTAGSGENVGELDLWIGGANIVNEEEYVEDAMDNVLGKRDHTLKQLIEIESRPKRLVNGDCKNCFLNFHSF